MGGTDTKVYDYKAEAVREKLVRAFRESRGEATGADLVARTGLPVHQVETELRAVADEYGARVRVTESGEPLWSFPRGFHSRYRGFGPAFRKGLRTFRKGAAAVGKFLFKIWIVVMLVGYFALFVALAVLALVASFAASSSGRGDDRRSSRGRGGIGGAYMLTRVIELVVRIWFYSEFTKSSRDPFRAAERRRAKKPLHTAIFSFVFGDPDPAASRAEDVRSAFAAYVRSRKGMATVEELSALAGLTPAEADDAMNSLAYELGGSPEVSDEGTVYWKFDDLMRSAGGERGAAADPGPLPLRRFSANPASANAWFCAFNGVNLAFGGYFLFSVLSGAPLGNPETGYTFYGFVTELVRSVGLDPQAAIGVGLGVVPVVFAILFWLVPALRFLALKADNARRARANLRRRAARAVLSSPDRVDPSTIAARAPEEDGDPAALVEELAVAWQGEPEADGTWRFPETARRLRDLSLVRSRVDESKWALGGQVFDTDAP
ncbi:MAG: hypothetical protein KBC36_09445 [Spirochaetia bacterium]|nr:hypothetical protein [Spirochaetia bacterium]